MDFSMPHEAKMHRNESSAVSSIIGILRPSTAMKYSMLKLLIHV